jgi:hypothetical protein
VSIISSYSHVCHCHSHGLFPINKPNSSVKCIPPTRMTMDCTCVDENVVIRGLSLGFRTFPVSRSSQVDFKLPEYWNRNIISSFYSASTTIYECFWHPRITMSRDRTTVTGFFFKANTRSYSTITANIKSSRRLMLLDIKPNK